MAKGTSLVAQTVKRLSTMRDTRVRSLGWEDPLEKEMAIHSRTIAWKNPMDRGAWQATVHGVTTSWTGLSNFTSLHFNQLSGQEIFNTNLPYTTMRGEENTQIQPQLAFHMEEEKYQTPESFSCFCLTKGKKSIKHV